MIDKKYTNDILEVFIKVAPYMPQFFNADISIAIADCEKFLFCESTGDLKGMNIKDGTPITPGYAVYNAIKSGKTISKIVPKDVYGVEFKTTAAPIKNDFGKVVGCVSIGKSLKHEMEISNLSKKLSNTTDQISDIITNISCKIQETTSFTQTIAADVEEANLETKSTDEVLKFVQSVAQQTNLLGLNASIEAARAGEYGSGFNVVAKEIRKLSVSSSESIKQIDGVLEKIKHSVNNISENINSASSIFQEQSAQLEEMSASIQELNASSHILQEIASKF